MFTTEHFIWLAVCLAFIAGLTILSLKLKFSFRTASFVMAVIALFSELSKIFSHMEFVNEKDLSKGMVIDAEALPLHLCSLLIFAFFYLPFCKNEKLKKHLTSFIAPVGLLGSVLAIIMATSGTDFTTPYAYQCFIYHAGMVWYALYLIITKQAEMGKKAWLVNLTSLFCLAIVMIWVNGVLQEYNTNFLYVVRPPVSGLPLLNLDRGWYVYFATLVSCGFAGITLMHLPFMMGEHKNKDRI